MAIISTSTTSPVNPPGTSTPLTHSDLWQTLITKARHPEEFVSAIETSRIVREDENGLTRAVKFKGADGEVEEVVRFVGMMKIDFHVPSTGQFVSNIISSAPGGDLYLTFTFEFPHEVAEGSEEVQKLEEKFRNMGGSVVPRTIEVGRGLKGGGKLG